MGGVGCGWGNGAGLFRLFQNGFVNVLGKQLIQRNGGLESESESGP